MKLAPASPLWYHHWSNATVRFGMMGGWRKTQGSGLENMRVCAHVYVCSISSVCIMRSKVQGAAVVRSCSECGKMSSMNKTSIQLILLGRSGPSGPKSAVIFIQEVMLTSTPQRMGQF
ncbi:unnamed protein product [Ostreobium quekettii]|uniref:Uncharacterized protein n=1 Tax=Ostreobium quekettii TaxID=121088 RepID=A0A8S1IZL7_9CHLO|nr:unnamed protein product [Ostreobium quekettii]